MAGGQVQAQIKNMKTLTVGEIVYNVIDDTVDLYVDTEETATDVASLQDELDAIYASIGNIETLLAEL